MATKAIAAWVATRLKMSSRRESTIAALLKERPKRGRPRLRVSRQNVYVALSPEQRAQIEQVAREMPEGLSRADMADVAVHLLAVRLELLRQAVADRDREIPEGITDLDSLYLLWDLPLRDGEGEAKWTSVRVSPQQVIELGRSHGMLNAIFGANRSNVFGLGLALLQQFTRRELAGRRYRSVDEIERLIREIYL